MSGGGCLCGAVRYRVAGALRPVVVCHCVDCRRWHGRAAAMTCAARENVTISGEAALRWFGRPGGPERGFCARCGSSLFWVAPERGSISIAAGSLDDPGSLRVAAHIWCEHAASFDVDRPEGAEHHPRGAPPAVSAPPRRP